MREWRRNQTPPVSQDAFATRAKVSVGCVQSFEAGTRHTTEAKIDRIVAVLGVSKEQLFSEDEFPDARVDQLLRTHPLMRDLRAEDLRVAHDYHHAGAEAKYAIKALFSPTVSEEIRERVARVLEQLLRFHDAMLPEFEAFLGAWEIPRETGPSVPATPPLKNHAHGRR